MRIDHTVCSGHFPIILDILQKTHPSRPKSAQADLAPSVIIQKQIPSVTSFPHSSTKSGLAAGLLQDRLHHLISKRGRFREARSKVRRNSLKAITVGFKVPKGDTVGPCLMRKVS